MGEYYVETYWFLIIHTVWSTCGGNNFMIEEAQDWHFEASFELVDNMRNRIIHEINEFLSTE